VAVRAVRVLGSVGGLFDLRLALVSRSSSTVAVMVLGCPFIIILSPLVVVSAHLAGVLLVVVLVGVDEVVGLAVPGVVVRAVGLLGPRVVVVASRGGLLAGGCSVVSGTSLAVAVAGAVATVTVAGAVAGAVAVLSDVTSGGLGAVRGGAVDILILAPSLGAPFVGVSVVPLIVRLGIVGLSPGLLVRLIDLELLLTAIGVPVLARGVGGASGTGPGGGVGLATVALSVATVLLPLGGGGAVLLGITVGVIVTVLSPLVIIGLEPPSVLGALVVASLHGVVRLAPSGVLILTVSLLGPGVVVVSTVGGLAVGGGTLPVRGAVATLAGAVDVTVLAGGSLARCAGGSVGVSVGTPSLGSPLVVILVVPLIVRLSGVALGLGVVERDSLGEVLIATIGVEIVRLTGPVFGRAVLGGSLEVATVAVAVAVALAALSSSGGSGAVAAVVTLGVGVAVLSPLVVVGEDLTGVVLVVEGLGLDGVVGLAPPGVEVGALSLLGVRVVVRSGLLGLSLPGGAVLGLAGGSLATVGFAVRAVAVAGAVRAVAVAGAVAGAVTVARAVAVRAVLVATVGLSLLTVVGGRGVVSLRGSTVGIVVLAPLLGTVGVVVLVVPFIVGLSAVRLGAGVAVRLLDGEVLIATIGVPVGGDGLHALLAGLLGGLAGGSSLLDDAGVGNVVDLGVAAVAALGTVAGAVAALSGGTVAGAVAGAVAALGGGTVAGAVSGGTVAIGFNLDGLDDRDEGADSERFHYLEIYFVIEF